MLAATISIAACLAQTPVGQPLIRTTTRLVQVNVVVHDRSVPVGDLGKDDFLVLDRGVRRAIAVFNLETRRSAAAAQAPEPRGNVFTNDLARDAGTPASVTVVLLDGLNTRIEDQSYARKQVKAALGSLKPEDHVAIYTLGRTLSVLHDFTSDPRQLEQVLARFRGRLDSAVDASEPESVHLGNKKVDDAINNALGNRADLYAADRARRTAEALEAIANHVAPLRGRKNLVWISASFPLGVGTDPATAGRPAAERRAFHEEIERAERALNDANLAIYPVDARGLVGIPGALKAEGSTTGVQAARSPLSRLTPAGQDTMTALASRTGGKAFYNTSDIAGAIRQAIEDTEVTYTLGFYLSGDSLDGKYHELDVRVPGRKGLTVRSRRGYHAYEQAAPGPGEVKAAFDEALWSPLEENGLSVRTRVERVPRPDGESLELAVTVPAQQVSFEHADERWNGAIDLVTAQLDSEGRVLSASGETSAMTLKNDSYQRFLRNGIPLSKSLKLDAGAEQIRVVVLDRATGATGSLIIPLAEIR